MGNILINRDKFIVTITLNREEKLNALTKGMWQELGEKLTELADDPDIRVIMITGAGERSFSPGNDIAEFEKERSNKEQARAYGAIMHGTLTALSECPVPTIARIRGICVGGGLEIAACCDIRICSTDSRFGVPINQLGLVMAYPEISALEKLVGYSRAAEILFRGHIFDAESAREMGIVNHIANAGEIDRLTNEIAGEIASGAPLVARWHKKFLRRLDNPEPLTSDELEEGFACYDTEDFRIGTEAFLAKSKPDFVGR